MPRQYCQTHSIISCTFGLSSRPEAHFALEPDVIVNDELSMRIVICHQPHHPKQHSQTLNSFPKPHTLLQLRFHYRKRPQNAMAPRALLPLRFRMPFVYTTRRPLSITPRMLIKEDADRSPGQVEKAKQEQLKEQQQGQGRWREDLASHGESNIASDKEKVNDHKDHIEKLQHETKRKGEKGAI